VPQSSCGFALGYAPKRQGFENQCKAKTDSKPSQATEAIAFPPKPIIPMSAVFKNRATAKTFE
jgi:hypothetical protein